MNSIIRFFKNKNTVTILGILAVAAALVGAYAYQINKQVKPKSVPVAAKTIQPKTKITSDMIKYVDVPSAYISDNAVINSDEILKMYSNYNTVIPEGSMFYNEALNTPEKMPNYLLSKLKNGEFLVSFEPGENGIPYGIMPGSKIDLYMKINSDQGAVQLGRFLENVEVIDVVDDSGNSVYEVSDGTREPSKLVFGLQEDVFLLLFRANYLNVQLFPVQHGTWIDDSQSTIKLSTDELVNYIKSNSVQYPSDPVAGQIRNPIQKVEQ